MTEDLRSKWIDPIHINDRLRGLMGVDEIQEVVILMDGYLSTEKCSRIVSNDAAALMRFVKNIAWLISEEPKQGERARYPALGTSHVIVAKHARVGLYYELRGRARAKALDMVPIMPPDMIDEFLTDFFNYSTNKL